MALVWATGHVATSKGVNASAGARLNQFSAPSPVAAATNASTSPQAAIQPQAASSTFPIWKTITLGTSKDAEALIAALAKNNNFFITPFAGYMMLGKPFAVSESKTRVNLVNVSVSDLGLKDGAKTQDVYSRAKELGLLLSPAEVGPQLRLQYKNQPKGEGLLVAMKPIAGTDPSFLFVFSVEHDAYGYPDTVPDDGVLQLDGRDGEPNASWHTSDHWVFIRPQ